MADPGSGLDRAGLQKFMAALGQQLEEEELEEMLKTLDRFAFVGFGSVYICL